MSYTVTFIPGDGTGPEIAEATKKVLEATGVEFNWDIQEAGLDVFKKEGNPLPARVLESLKKNKVGIKGPITTPVGSGFRSVNVALRKELDLYCCLRPCKSYAGVQSKYTNIDLVIVRENTEDLYAGIEYQRDSSSAQELIATIERLSGVKIRKDSGISIKPISEFGTKRIV
ncbi:isocitrate/isopropylmalate family dehydrogenase, partial [Methanobacterium sp.]|uniref:isocitrate/isopropylmalate family dehydrogenase n=1 Tax=Methanobacterium sp. TaxID=2164 RepID=UPI0025E5BF37